MYQFLSKYGQLCAFGLGLLISVIYFTQVFTGLDGFNALSKEAQLGTGIFNFGLSASIGLAVLCVLTIASFGLLYFFRNPSKAIRGILPFLLIGVLAVILFMFSQAEQSGPMMELAQRFELTPNVEKFISAGLWTSLIMFGAAILFLAAMEVRNLFN